MGLFLPRCRTLHLPLLIFANKNYLQPCEIHAALRDVCLYSPPHRQDSSFATSTLQQNRKMLKPEI